MYTYYIVAGVVTVLVLVLVLVLVYFFPKKSRHLTRVERLIKEQASLPTTERYENTNETVPNAKMLELYERMFTVLPPSLKELLDCNTARNNRSHMYSLVGCILSKMSNFLSVGGKTSASDQSNPIPEEQLNELLVILVWIRFMIEHDLSDIVQILTYEPQSSRTSDGAIKIVHPQFKALLEVLLADMKNPTKSRFSSAGSEFFESITASVTSDTLKIRQFVDLVLQFSDSISPEGPWDHAKCGCNYDEKAAAAAFLLANENKRRLKTEMDLWKQQGRTEDEIFEASRRFEMELIKNMDEKNKSLIYPESRYPHLYKN